MKKVICTLTAVAFTLGLAGAGYSQAVTKDTEKPAVKMETQTAPSPVAPEKEQVGKTDVKQVPQGKPDVVKKTEKGKDKVKKDAKQGAKKDDKAPATKVEEPKKEEKK